MEEKHQGESSSNVKNKSESIHFMRTALLSGGVILLLLVVSLSCYLAGAADGRKARKLYTPRSRAPEVLRSRAGQLKPAGCTEAPICSKIAKHFLEMKGTAVDATVAAMFCNGVVNQHNMGIGGGFFMTIYSRSEGRAYAVNAREKAPMKAHRDMYRSNPNAPLKGPLAVSIPGEVKGLWTVHRRWGKLPWRVLMEPAIKICREGYAMTEMIQGALSVAKWVKNDPELRKQYFNPKTNEPYDWGVHLTVNQVLCNTLSRISAKGGDDLYTGELAKDLIADLADVKSIITKEDLKNYRVKITEPLKFDFDNGDVLYVPPPPSGGLVLINIMNIMRGYNLTHATETLDGIVLAYHRIIEAFKFAYVTRSKMGDPDFLGPEFEKLVKKVTDPKYGEAIRHRINDSRTYNETSYYDIEYFAQDDSGTAHFSMIDSFGDAVSVTSSINCYYGSGFTLKRTGMIPSDVMDDFSSPGIINYYGFRPAPSNFIEPGKRPMSSLAPSIVVDNNGDVRLVVGATGGPKAVASVALVLIRNLWMGMPVKESVLEPLLFHQVIPMIMDYEDGFYDDILDGLRQKGHGVNVTYHARWSMICAVPE